MKSIQKITRVHLKINQKYESILIGIVSAEPDYKISLTLNKKFDISLKNISSIKIDNKKGDEITFSRYSDSNRSPDISYNLVSNRSGMNHLLKKLKNIDYIFQINDPDSIMNISNLTASIREIETITAVFNLDLNQIKDKNLHYLIQ
jgi:hypothetical protein